MTPTSRVILQNFAEVFSTSTFYNAYLVSILLHFDDRFVAFPSRSFVR